MRKVNHGGGWQAISYSLRAARKLGPVKFWRAMRSRNACKTCAVGMGGQLGGMVNEARHFPEVCKKSVQAMAADMQGRIEPQFFERYTLAELQAFSPRELEEMGRLTQPIIARPGDTHYRPVSWDEALDALAEALKATPPERTFFYVSGRSSNEAGFTLNLFCRSYGTNHLSNCSYYCHQASGAGLTEGLGTSTATVALEDLDKCDLVFLIGGNPASNHPRLMTKLMKLRRRGGKVIVVNPIKEVGLQNFRVPSSTRSMLFGSPIASLFVQPTIGGDIAWMAGLAKALLEEDAIDQAYIHAATEEFQAFRTYTESLTWEQIVAESGVPKSTILAAAKLYAASERTIFSWTMGITHHEHGTANVRWIVNLALLRGMLGKPGAGVLPIRGHSNIQGMGSVGVSPAVKKAVLERMTALGVAVPTFAGYDTMAALEAAGRGEMDFALCLGGNLYGASPDADFVHATLAKLGTVAYMSTTLNTGHAHGLGKTTVVLPVLARDEEPQSTTQESMFNYVRLSDGGPPRHEGPRSEVEVIAELAHRVLGSKGVVDWEGLKDHDAIRRLIAKLIPGMDAMDKIGQTKEEFEIPGRVLHQPRFPTESGKAKFSDDPLPTPARLEPDQLRVMTIRSEGQFNTVVYEEKDLYRGQERRDVLLMNGEDIARMGLKADQRIDVWNAAGMMRGLLVRAIDIAPGCAAAYYPEANVLVGRKVDPRSKTPGFKHAIAAIRPSTGEKPIKLGRPEDRPRLPRPGSMKAC